MRNSLKSFQEENFKGLNKNVSRITDFDFGKLYLCLIFERYKIRMIF